MVQPVKARQTCGKRRFRNEYDAGKRLKRAQARAARNYYKYPLRYYECSTCHGFHLTSKPLREEAEPRTWVILQDFLIPA